MKYDLHCHTHYSNCSLNSPQTILKAALKKGLDGIAITDHNKIKGAFAVKRLNKNKDFEVIIGEEVMTDKCEILCYYLTSKIKPGSAEEVIDQVRQQGAVCSIAHPFTFGIYRKVFHLDNKAILRKVDAVEAFNARTQNSANKKAQALAHKFGLARTAGSDGHMWWEVGQAYTEFSGDLKKALKRKKTRIYGCDSFSFFNRLITLPVKVIRSKITRFK